jgi:biotin carboxylase
MQFRADSLDEILARTQTQNLHPVLIKPLNSTSSEGVFICESEEEIRAAFAHLMGHKNALGYLNRAVVVQEFLSGTEYVVDTVSYAGVHRAASFWRYHKSNLATSMAGPECIELLSSEGEIQRELFDYSKRVLDALGVRYGAAHIELIWSKKGPVLIEIGARVNGGNNPLICRTCTGSSQIELLVDAYLKSERFVEMRHHNYALHKKGIRVFFIPRCKGEFRKLSALDEIKALESFHEIYLGSRKSWDAPRRIGWVILVHEDASVVERDLARVRELEETELYTQ